MARPRTQRKARRTTRRSPASRRDSGGRGRALTPRLLRTSRSAVRAALLESTNAVKSAGTGLVNTAREVITGTVTGGHDAVSVLKSQHREVEGLFKRVLEAEDARTRRALLEDITRALTVHTKIEEDLFYPAVRRLGTEATERLIDEALEEHHVVDLVLEELPRVRPDDDRFHAKITVLSELVDHHVQEEERDMFRRAQELGRAQLAELGTRLEQATARHQAAKKGRG
jgi:hemerythrin superfamily protein